MRVVKLGARLLLALGLLLPAFAQAADALSASPARVDQPAMQATHGAEPEQASTSAQAAGSVRDVPASINADHGPQHPIGQTAGLGQSMPLETLDQYRGGTAVNSIKSEAVSNGLLQDATANHVATGNNTIADGAFSNAIGLPIVIQNSGANVLIQNSTIVNVQFR